MHNSSAHPQANNAPFGSNLDVNGSIVASGGNHGENRLVQNSTGAENSMVLVGDDHGTSSQQLAANEGGEIASNQPAEEQQADEAVAFE